MKRGTLLAHTAPDQPKKLPRGHAYIRMRNGGTAIHFDMPAVDDPVAERMMEAALAVWRDTRPEDH